MSAEATDVYRSRIYQSYSSARATPLAPNGLIGLKPRLPYLRQLVHRHVPEDRNCSILELGCGYGALLYVLQDAGYASARGIDGSAEQVATAHRLGISGVELGDVTTVLAETPDATLDVVISFDVIEHFTKAELIPLIDLIYRALKPGGRWIIHVPNAEGPFGGRIQHSDFTHELAFTRTSLDQLLRASGFVRIDCFEDRPVPHGLKSAIRAILWALIRAGLLSYVAIETGVLDRQAAFSQNLLAVAAKGEGV